MNKQKLKITGRRQETGKISLERAEKVAAAVVKRLEPYCKKIAVAGSIRRRRLWVSDVDILLIPSDLWNLHHEIRGLGPVEVSGQKILRITVGDVPVDIYVASEETWATLLLIRTGSKESNIRLCTLAQKRGWRLAASGDGLFDENGQRIAGDTEASIYGALGLEYVAPQFRERG